MPVEYDTETHAQPRKASATPTDRESPFGVGELFFSTTDAKGFITAGNDVFVRVSRFRREDLMGAPHRVIRHPDMPRVVFKLLWDTIQAGKGITAYMKNMAADGSYYWVLAVVTPVDGGYLSVRLKPTSDFFKPIVSLYADLRAIEQQVEAKTGSRQQAMAASGEALATALKSLGFANYDEFQDAALAHETRARRAVHPMPAVAVEEPCRSSCQQIAAGIAGLCAQLDTLRRVQSELVDHTAGVRTLATSLQRLSLNAHIRAMHLHDVGATIEVVADHMYRSARGVSESGARLGDAMRSADRTLSAARAAIATADLSVEMMLDFVGELAVAKATGQRIRPDLRTAVAQLGQVVEGRLDAARARAVEVSHQVALLDAQLHDFRKQVRTLEILHVTGRTEAIRVPDGTHVSMIFDEVHAVTSTARLRLDGLGELLEKVELKQPQRVTGHLAAIVQSVAG